MTQHHRVRVDARNSSDEVWDGLAASGQLATILAPDALAAAGRLRRATRGNQHLLLQRAPPMIDLRPLVIQADTPQRANSSLSTSRTTATT